MSTVLRNTAKNIRRSPFQSLAAVLILILTFFTLQVFALLIYAFGELTAFFETRPQVTAFFEDTINESEILSLKAELEGFDYVESVKYVSKDEALEIYQSDNKEDPLLLEMVTADILPASLEVSAVKVDNLGVIKNQLESEPGVEEVTLQQDVVEELKKWSDGIEIFGLSIISFLAATSILVLVIIISIKIASKRVEIATLRLLGASSWFIRGPFLLEGAFYGLVSALISWGILLGLLYYLTPQLQSFLGEIPLLPFSNQTLMALGGLAVSVAVIIGMLSAFMASRRYYR